MFDNNAGYVNDNINASTIYTTTNGAANNICYGLDVNGGSHNFTYANTTTTRKNILEITNNNTNAFVYSGTLTLTYTDVYAITILKNGSAYTTITEWDKLNELLVNYDSGQLTRFRLIIEKYCH